LRDRLPPKGVFSGSRDLFKFGEISGSTVSRKRCEIDTLLQLRTNKKSYVAYRMAPIRVTFSDLEGQFCCSKTLCHPPVVRVHDGALEE